MITQLSCAFLKLLELISFISFMIQKLITLFIAKNVNHFVFQEMVPYATYFKLEGLSEYHRVIAMDEFMEELADLEWPLGNRKGLHPRHIILIFIQFCSKKKFY